MKKFLLLLAICCCFFIAALTPLSVLAQLCTGSLGDPVVNITFGAGSNPGAPLTSTGTNLSFVDHDCPNDGYYAIRNSTSNCFGDSWHTFIGDHTGDHGGYFMLVNASYQPSDFYVSQVDGLCPNTTYQFASWILNLLRNQQSILPNLTFTIEKTDGTILKKFDTGDIPAEGCAEWRQYGFFFTNGSDQSVVLRIRNNAPGGIGNDLCLDDITFSPCGPQVRATITGGNINSGSVCEGNNIPITITGEVMAGYTTPVYQWQVNENGTSWLDIAGATSTDFTTTPGIVGSYAYRMAVAESGNLGIPSCRINSNVINVSVQSNPEINFVASAPACEGTTAVLEATVDYRSPGGASRNWTTPAAAITGTASTIPGDSMDTGTERFSIPNATVGGSGFFKLEVKNLYGCIAVDSAQLNIQPRPVNTVTTTRPPCEGMPVTFLGSSTMLNPYSVSFVRWDFDGGNSSTNQNPDITFNTPGQHQVRYLTVASNGCMSDTAFQSITVHASPTADFLLPEVCVADPFAQFTDQSIDAGNGGTALQYSWQFDDPSGTNNTSNLKDPTHHYSSVGQYNVSLMVTSANGCIGDTLKVVTVNGSSPQSMFSINPSSIRCSDDSVMIVNQSTVDYGSLTRIEIFWDYDRDPTNKSIDDNPVTGASYSHAYTNTPVVGAQYRIRYIVYSGTNCMNESEQFIDISKSPSIAFNPLAPVCQEAAAFMIAQASETSGIAGSGVYSGLGVSSSGLFTPASASSGNNTITYSYTSATGCISNASQDIVVHATPIVDAGPDRIMLTGGQIILQATAKGDNLQYDWSPASSIANPAELQPVIRPPAETLYTLKVSSGAGCQAEDQVLVKVVETIAIPNAFTPNGDGKNDTWKIPYIDSYPGFVVQVYNRYGQLVYRSNDGIVNWDGTLAGKPQDAGTYVYVFDRKQFGGVARGTIMLIR